jgi:hypothetical protein
MTPMERVPNGESAGLSPRADMDVVFKRKSSVMPGIENPAVN